MYLSWVSGPVYVFFCNINLFYPHINPVKQMLDPQSHIVYN